MLVLRDWNGKTVHVEDYDYAWLAFEKEFKCELRDVDIGLIAEAVKCSGSWVSTSPAGSHHHNVDITVYADDPLTGAITIKVQCFTWEPWDAEKRSVKITGVHWGVSNTWKGYGNYVRYDA